MCSFLSFIETSGQLIEIGKQLKVAQTEARKYKSTICTVANFLGNHIVNEVELFSKLLLKPHTEYEKILEAKTVLDLIFHVDKGFVSEDESKRVKQNLNSTFTVLCSKNNHKYYCDLLIDYHSKLKNQSNVKAKYCIDATTVYMEKQSEKLRE